jgi:hypothetical protein
MAGPSMPQDPEECVKCGGTMEQGFVADIGHIPFDVSSWATGAPKAAFFGGIKMPSGQRVPSRTYR